MPNYTFQETINYFSSKLGSAPPSEDIEAKTVELSIDNVPIVISQGALKGSLNMEIALGLLLQHPQEEELKDLASSNFLGMNTGGCTLAHDPDNGMLFLRSNLSSGTPPQETWEWLHRMLHIAHVWVNRLLSWNEFIRLIKNGEKHGTDQNLKEVLRKI